MRKNIAEIINIRENMFNGLEEDNCIHEYVLKVVEEHRKARDEFYYQCLYETAKEKGITTLFVIDLPQFKRFINDCLLKWLKGEIKNEL